jgi:hypothetical protein
VVSYDPKTGKTTTQTVEHVWINHDTDLLDVTVRSGGNPAKTPRGQGADESATVHGRDARPLRALVVKLMLGALALVTALATPLPALAAQLHAITVLETAASRATGHGEVIHTTANHPWLTADQGWVLAGRLRPGEPVRRADRTTAQVVALRVVPGAAPMWDLTLDRVHTFAVGTGEFVVHNTDCGSTDEGTNDTFIGQRMQRRVNDDLLNPPASRGEPPTEAATGNSIEIHHVNQDPNGPFEEMTPFEHRGVGNFRANHPLLGRDYASRINRGVFNQQKDAYWAAEWDRGRWSN